MPNDRLDAMDQAARNRAIKRQRTLPRQGELLRPWWVRVFVWMFGYW
jgi:hypothetical protein